MLRAVCMPLAALTATHSSSVPLAHTHIHTHAHTHTQSGAVAWTAPVATTARGAAAAGVQPQQKPQPAAHHPPPKSKKGEKEKGWGRGGGDERLARPGSAIGGWAETGSKRWAAPGDADTQTSLLKQTKEVVCTANPDVPPESAPPASQALNRMVPGAPK